MEDDALMPPAPRSLARVLLGVLFGGLLLGALPAGAQSGTPAETAAPVVSPTPAAEATPADAPPKFREKPRYVPPFFIVDHDEERQSDFRMLMMLYWSDSNPDRSYHLLIPFFYERHNKHSDGTTWASPFFYFYKSPKSKAGYIPPVYIERGPEVSRTGVPPFFWYGRVGPKGHAETTSYLFPVYFYDEREGHRLLATPIGGGWGTKDDFQGLVGLYYWRNTHLHGDASPYGRDVDLDAHVFFPIFWHLATKDTQTWVAGPVFSSTQSTPSGPRRAFGALPFFYERVAPGGGRTVVTPLSVFERRDADSSFLVTPLGGYSRRPDHAFTMVGPYFDSVDHGERLQGIFPILFHGAGFTDQGREHHSWTVAGPYFERRREFDAPDGTRAAAVDRGLLPLFYYGRTGKDVSFVSPGVLYRKHENGDFRGLFGPFYRSYGHGRQTWILFPGAWHHSSPRIEQSFGFLPFYYIRKKAPDLSSYAERPNAPHDVPGETLAGLVPLFFYANGIQPWDGKRNRTVTLLPLFFFSEHPGRQTFVSPLFAQIRRPHDTRTMAALLWWDHETDRSRNLTLLPLFHWERDEDSRALLTPIGGYTRRGDYLSAVWGPVYVRRDPSLGIKHTVVVPFFWDLKTGDERVTIAPPYFQVKQGAYFSEGIVPFWFHSSFPGSSRTIVFPFFLAQYDKVEKTRTIFTPLGGLWTKEDPRAYKLLAPLVYRSSGPGQSTTVLFPLFWYDYDHGRQTTVVPPFFLRTDRDRKSISTGLFPLFYFHDDPGSAFFVTWPGILYARTEERRDTVVLPLLYWWSRDPYRSAGIAGPWLWTKSLRPGERDFTRTLFPLYYETAHGDRDAIVTPIGLRIADPTHSLYAFPGFGWATRRDPKTRELVGWNVLAGPLYVRHAPHAMDAVLFPLFWHTHDERHARTTVFPLLDYERKGEAWRVVTIAAGGGSDPSTHSSWWWALNTFHTQDRDVNTTTVLPIVYVRSSNTGNVVATPLFFHSADRETHTSTTLAPLFFRHTSPARDTWIAFPLAWNDVDKTRGIGAGGILPFAFWMRSKERSWTAVPLLLSYVERRGADHVAVYGPLVDYEIEGRRTVALVPIFRYHRDGDTSSFASLPFIFWLKRGPYTRAFVGAGYWNTETGTRVFPLYFRWQVHDDDRRIVRSTEVGLPIYVHYRTPDKDVVVVAPWYRVKRADGSKVVGVAPVWVATSKPGEKSWSVLGDLIGYQRQGDYSRINYLWVFSTKEKAIRKKKASRPAVLAEAHRERGC